MLKKEIRILGLSSPRESLFKPIIGAIFRGSWWLDGIVTYLPPKLTKSNVPRLATALRETKQYSQIQVAIFSREDILEHKFEDYRRLSELVEFPIFAISKRFPSNVAKYEFVRILQGKSRTTLWINEYSAERARDLYILGCRKGQSAPEAVIVAEQVANTFRYPQIKQRLNRTHIEGASRSLLEVQFCPKCGLALLPTQKSKSVVLSCPKCGYETKRSDRNIQKLEQQKENVVVIGKEEQKIRTLPKTKVDCPKCGHREAFYWLVQTRGADESSTQFFRCTSCGTTWRENS